MSQGDKNNSENIDSSGKDLSESKVLEFVKVPVQNTAGETFSINVNINESFKSVQERIQNQCGIPLSKQVFSCFCESTLSNGNDGMQQTFNEIRANVTEMKYQQKVDENETKNNRTNGENVEEANAQIVGQQKDTVQKSENGVCQISNQITNENADLIDPSRICKIEDVGCDDDEDDIDYELLKGKILEVDKLEYWRCQRKWLADNIGISFKNSEFLVYPEELCVVSHSNLSANILNRIVFNDLKSLYLKDTAITYSDYKKLTASQNLDHLHLHCVTVMDENGKRVEIDKLLKETKLIGYLYYKFNDGVVTSETAQKLAELSPFPKLRTFYLENVHESFDLKKFGDFLIKNPTITFCSLKFECSDKFYEEIKRAQNDLLPTLPSTCELDVYKSL